MGSEYEWGLPARYGGRFFVEGVPDKTFPEDGNAQETMVMRALVKENVSHTGARA